MLGIAFIGAGVFLISCIGYFGAKNESKKLLFIYSFFVFVLACAQVGSIVLMMGQADTLMEIAEGKTLQRASDGAVPSSEPVSAKDKAAAMAAAVAEDAKKIVYDQLLGTYESCCYNMDTKKEFENADPACTRAKRLTDSKAMLRQGVGCDAASPADLDAAPCGSCPAYKQCSKCKLCQLCFHSEASDEKDHKNREPTCIALKQMTYSDEAESIENQPILTKETCAGGPFKLAKAIAAWVEDNFNSLLALGIAFAVIQLVAITAACAMIFTKQYAGEWNAGSKTGPALA